jgi:hypothetical protein
MSIHLTDSLESGLKFHLYNVLGKTPSRMAGASAWDREARLLVPGLFLRYRTLDK